jgi:predicted nucleic acid-binding protein
MKALDTAVLLSILHGDKAAKELVRRLRGVEVASTELNFLELAALVRRGPVKGRGQRREAVDRLRRALTVLPFDGKAAERAAQRASKGDGRSVPPLVLGTLATLEVNGCDELVTADPSGVGGRWPFRVTKFGGS